MTTEAHRPSGGDVETPLRRWVAITLSALVVLLLAALIGSKLFGHETAPCVVPAIGFYAAPGTDPDIPAQQWLQEYWREPVDGAASRERTDEQARPTRVVTWTSETKSIESTMSEFPDGSWQGGLHGC